MPHSDVPQPGIWYGVGGFGFDLGRIHNLRRRGDLDRQQLNGHPGLRDVWEGIADLNAGAFSVLYGTTPIDFYSAPAGSIIWCLKP